MEQPDIPRPPTRQVRIRNAGCMQERILHLAQTQGTQQQKSPGQTHTRRDAQDHRPVFWIWVSAHDPPAQKTRIYREPQEGPAPDAREWIDIQTQEIQSNNDRFGPR